MYNLGHDPNTSKETDIIMRTPAGNTVSNNSFLIFICLKAFSKWFFSNVNVNINFTKTSKLQWHNMPK